MDDASIALIQTAHPAERDNMLAAYNACVANTPGNVHPSVVQVFRSIADSDALFQIGRDAAGNVINPRAVVSDAKGGQSWHNYGLAIDIEMIRDGQGVGFDNTPEAAALAAADPDYAIIINTMAGFGYTWGGNFPGEFRDVPHFENKRGQLLSDLFAKFEAGDLIAGTSYVNF
jgi:peptidoglycan L-alanyl-D-glutamate endopeptidase CwlK